MHTNVQPIPTSTTFFFELDGQRHDLAVPLLEGAAPLANDPPCSCCGSCDPHRFGRESNLVIAFSPAEDIGFHAEVCCIHCGHRWPIQQGKAA